MPAAADEWEALGMEPAEHDAPFERLAVGTTDAQGIVKIAQDGELADECAFVVREGLTEHGVERGGAGACGGRMLGAFTSQVTLPWHVRS